MPWYHAGMAGRFQFSIRFLLVATVAVAVGLAGYRAEHSWQGRLAMQVLTWLLATASILGVVQTSGRPKAFWIGTAFMLCIAAVHATEETSLLFLYHSNGLTLLRTESAAWAFWCAAPVNGLFAVFLDWLFSPRKPPA
ncbi:MAG TPA: hypothetical protein VG125_30645 [Pirellulales bacterium]|jgi:hypothetical protein|nr:hypothetical protein [Pirellulales bacterium]